MNIQEISDYIIVNSGIIKINSKDIKSGDIFVTLEGKKQNGSFYIQDAIDNGAYYIITNKLINNKIINKKIIIVKDIPNFLLAVAKKKRELFTGKVIGITGSIGKTTLKENLKYFLEYSFKVSASIKSYNNILGVTLSLLNMDTNSDYAIFEMGTNDFYEIRNLTSILKPSQVIITNIYPTHLEKLINLKNIAKEKSDIFNPDYNKKTKLAILPNNNKIDKIILDKAYNLKLFKIITFGKNLNSDLRIDKIKFIDNLYSEIYVKYQNKKITIIISNNQLTRINNILICLSIFIYNKINIDKFTCLTQNIPLIEGRGLHQYVVINNKKILFIDESYNASPESMKITIEYFNNLKLEKSQKKYLILGDMNELGKNSEKYHKDLIDQITKKRLENIILSGKFMEIALSKNIKNENILLLDKDSILDYLVKKVNKNDIILIKGSNTSNTNDVAKELLNRKEL